MRVRGSAVIPAEVPSGIAARMVIEVRDASLADVPAPLVARVVLRDVPLAPGGRLPYEITVPDVPGVLVLSVRVERGEGGDLLTTRAVPVTGDRLVVTPLTLVA
ncbi:hypothetical protein [Streptosporangium sp. NPDC000396]|uniref:hypothetical protein n=1 Tax=Streptosporangium sp. NPDC000396 TaxID=3366185 RepID=UPI00367E7E50